jgi:hypothetical protein
MTNEKWDKILDTSTEEMMKGTSKKRRNRRSQSMDPSDFSQGGDVIEEVTEEDVMMSSDIE